MIKTEWDKLSNHDKAWRLNQIMESMNDEEAYYSGWLYIWPDGETYQECCLDFENPEDYLELEASFKAYYSDPEIHEGGLYCQNGIDPRIVEDAHMWDNILGLSSIKVMKL